MLFNHTDLLLNLISLICIDFFVKNTKTQILRKTFGFVSTQLCCLGRHKVNHLLDRIFVSEDSTSPRASYFEENYF